MTHIFTIRSAQTDDLDRLMDLYSQLSEDNAPLPNATSREVFAKFSHYEGSVILVGEIGDAIVSTCTVVIIPNLTRRGMPYALIENVVTHADHRRYGYANSLLDAATKHAFDYGCYKVMLMTGSQDRQTLAFYERAGFEQSKTGFQKRKIAKRA